jgi:hypothetical protein
MMPMIINNIFIYFFIIMLYLSTKKATNIIIKIIIMRVYIDYKNISTLLHHCIILAASAIFFSTPRCCLLHSSYIIASSIELLCINKISGGEGRGGSGKERKEISIIYRAAAAMQLKRIYYIDEGNYANFCLKIFLLRSGSFGFIFKM